VKLTLAADLESIQGNVRHPFSLNFASFSWHQCSIHYSNCQHYSNYHEVSCSADYTKAEV